MSSVFYGAYVFFEKLRVKENKPKSKKRKEMEEVWAKHGGMDLEHRRDRVTAPKGAIVTQDQYGVMHVDRPGGGPAWYKVT
jgi:hypothetical protein